MSDKLADEAMLIERFGRGEKDALDILIQRNQARAYQYAFRLTRNQDEACDVVADAFVRVYKAMEQFRGHSSFTTWLYRIITNCFLDMKKKQSNRPMASLDAAIGATEGEVFLQIEDTQGPDPHEVAERSDQQVRIREAIEKLPEYQKVMILMYHSQNLSYEEMAHSLELPIGTVKSRLNRARHSLCHLLKDQQSAFIAA
jgi:RNA polymerase sigma-70 factor, ECF subfamily